MKEFIVTMANIIEYGTFFFPHRHETLEKWQYFCGCVEQMLEAAQSKGNSPGSLTIPNTTGLLEG